MLVPTQDHCSNLLFLSLGLGTVAKVVSWKWYPWKWCPKVSLEGGGAGMTCRGGGHHWQDVEGQGLWLQLSGAESGLTGACTEQGLGGWGMGWEICAPAPGDERVRCNPTLVLDLEGARFPLANGRTTKH